MDYTLNRDVAPKSVVVSIESRYVVTFLNSQEDEQ
jgi:hypothetical protein